ncbi:MAG: hypothetical protein F4071_06575, partial [Acidimicrobiaceae bacterium]|nr:hypothetical protein [Acidimicrobiaceae bacterium]
MRPRWPWSAWAGHCGASRPRSSSWRQTRCGRRPPPRPPGRPPPTRPRHRRPPPARPRRRRLGHPF